jgi:hypothetical protein
MSNKHTAKRLGKDIYQYRGWIIRKFDNNYLLDPEIRGVQWNTYRNLDEYKASRTIDILATLKGARWSIDVSVDMQTAKP